MNEKLLKMKENQPMMSEKEFCKKEKTCDLFFLDC